MQGSAEKGIEASAGSGIDLRSATAGALRWAAGTKLIAQVIGWGLTLMVIRLLDPADYGLMAMTMAIVSLASFFTGFGFTASIVRSPVLESGHLAAILGMSIAINLVMFVAVFALAPLCTLYYTADVTDEIRVASLTFLLAPWGSIHEAQLVRALDFRRRALVMEGAFVLGSMTSLALAYLGFGVWSLIGGILVGAVARATVFTALAPERHWPSFRLSHVREQVSFGGRFMVQRLFWWLHVQIDVFVLGRLLPVAELGYYSVARTVASLPNNKLGQLMGPLPLAAFSKLQDRPKQLRNALRQALAMLLRLTIPSFVMLSATTPEIVAVVLGADWMPVAPVMALLALAMPIRLVHAVTNQAMNALGRPGVGAANMAFLMVASGIAIGLAAPYGTAAVAATWAVVYALTSLVALHVAGRYTGLGLPSILSVVWRPVLVGIVIYGSIFGARLVMPAGLADWVLLLALPAIGGLAGLCAMLITDRHGIYDTLKFIRS